MSYRLDLDPDRLLPLALSGGHAWAGGNRAAEQVPFPLRRRPHRVGPPLTRPGRSLAEASAALEMVAA